MNQKKDLLLDQIIQRYIESQEPIGSESLKMSMNFKISSASIRNYFKILSNEGILTQTHISSGRVPTIIGLKKYWKNHLYDNTSNQDSILSTHRDKIEYASKQHQIFVLIGIKENEILKEVLNVKNTYLILVFQTESILCSYHPSIERFAKELIGLNTQDIKKVCKEVCAHTLLEKIHATFNLKIYSFGLEWLSFLLHFKEFQKLFFNIMQGDIFHQLSPGIYFENVLPSGYMGIMQDICFETKDAYMLCVGALDKNYTEFFNQLAS